MKQLLELEAELNRIVKTVEDVEKFKKIFTDKIGSIETSLKTLLDRISNMDEIQIKEFEKLTKLYDEHSSDIVKNAEMIDNLKKIVDKFLAINNPINISLENLEENATNQDMLIAEAESIASLNKRVERLETTLMEKIEKANKDTLAELVEDEQTAFKNDENPGMRYVDQTPTEHDIDSAIIQVEEKEIVVDDNGDNEEPPTQETKTEIKKFKYSKGAYIRGCIESLEIPDEYIRDFLKITQKEIGYFKAYLVGKKRKNLKEGIPTPEETIEWLSYQNPTESAGKSINIELETTDIYINDKDIYRALYKHYGMEAPIIKDMLRIKETRIIVGAQIALKHSALKRPVPTKDITIAWIRNKLNDPQFDIDSYIGKFYGEKLNAVGDICRGLAYHFDFDPTKINDVFNINEQTISSALSQLEENDDMLPTPEIVIEWAREQGIEL